MKYFLIIVLLTISLSTKAQNDSLKTLPVQLSFVYPLGTSGTNSTNFVYNFSLNALIGRTGGLDGFEVAGLLNTNTGNISGAQFAGIGNSSGGRGKDVAQFAGIYNFVGSEHKGFMAAGIINGVGGSANSAQFAGIANKSSGLEGVQFAGITNLSRGNTSGVQGAGIVNYSGGDTKGLQIAGISNIANQSRSLFQIAGVSNIADSAVDVQIAGIFNSAKIVNGIQVAGILNICDSINGVPFALLSIVKKNGYRRFDLWANELTYVNLSYKIGVKKFYTIYSMAYNTESNYNLYFGAGLGSSISIGTKNALDIEYQIYQATKSWTMTELNLWNQLKVNLVQNFGTRFAIFLGPSINLLISENVEAVKEIIPDWTKTYKHKRTYLSYWVGINGGLRF